MKYDLCVSKGPPLGSDASRGYAKATLGSNGSKGPHLGSNGSRGYICLTLSTQIDSPSLINALVSSGDVYIRIQ